MKVRAIAPFYDLKEKCDRKPAEVFDCTEARFKELNTTEYGTLAERVEEKQTRKPTARKAAKGE